MFLYPIPKVMITIQRALISVSDKSGLVPLAKTLHEFGCEIISTGGYKQSLAGKWHSDY
jgi:phosphoribosylaminoimidazolecarboxamide formyltransferase/IMP cyclohydrolase